MTRPTLVRAAVAGAASAAFGALARVRHRKPLHPHGLVVPARLVRHGLREPLGASWLDEPGIDEGVARVSRSAGLPDGWPDVWGLALRLDPVSAPSGAADLMLAGAFAGRAGRHALALRRGPRAPLSCVLPYRTDAGRSVTIGVPARSGPLPSDRAALAGELRRLPVTMTLAVAAAGGDWQPFGTLTIGGAVLGTGDGHDDPHDTSFDPVLNPLPGLRLPDPVASVRARAYAGARAGRGADPATVHRLPSRS